MLNRLQISALNLRLSIMAGVLAVMALVFHALTGWVLPSATRNAAPRNDISPPSVTTNEGTPKTAVNHP